MMVLSSGIHAACATAFLPALRKAPGVTCAPPSTLPRCSCSSFTLDGHSPHDKPERMATHHHEVTSTALLAASNVIGSACATENQAFLLCKSINGDPEGCLKVGEQVTGCVLSV